MNLSSTILFISAILLLNSCNTNSRKEKSTSLEDYKNFDTIVPFSGSWISEDYYNSIVKFKSPSKAQDNSLFINIPDRTLQKTMMIHNFHEGGTELKILKNKNIYEVWGIHNDSLFQKLYDIKILSPTKIKLNETNFIKFNSTYNQNNMNVLEEILFSGVYTDVLKNRIEFKSDGKIIGLDDFQFYVPIYDYYDEGMQVDQIQLGINKEKLDYFSFKFNNDTLFIYKLKCVEFDNTSQNCGIVDFGQLIHKLWKLE